MGLRAVLMGSYCSVWELLSHQRVLGRVERLISYSLATTCRLVPVLLRAYNSAFSTPDTVRHDVQLCLTGCASRPQAQR